MAPVYNIRHANIQLDGKIRHQTCIHNYNKLTVEAGICEQGTYTKYERICILKILGHYIDILYMYLSCTASAELLSCVLLDFIHGVV